MEVLRTQLGLCFKAERYELSLYCFAVEGEGASGATDRAGAGEVASQLLVFEAFFVAKPPRKSGARARHTARAAAEALDPPRIAGSVKETEADKS